MFTPVKMTKRKVKDKGRVDAKLVAAARVARTAASNSSAKKSANTKALKVLYVVSFLSFGRIYIEKGIPALARMFIET